MKIAIHGTKGGYHIFTSERIPGLIDARPDYNKVATIRQEAYAVNFNSNYVIFSKYRIIRDVPGEKRIGNIAFSLVIANNKKLSGTDVKALLDQLADEYYSRYIPGGENLDNEREDWAFVEVLTKDYENRLKPVPAEDIENTQPGTAEAAYVYYTFEEELQKYLDEPYQEEYKKYKQIFFVKNDLNNLPENPLNALRHNSSANLTGQIELDNPKYKLLFNENAKGGVKIQVLIEGLQYYSTKKIRKNSVLEIVYTKPYYKDEIIKGKCTEIDSKYINVNNSAQTITIKEIDLLPEIKDITFETRDSKLLPVTGARVFCVNHNSKKEALNNQVRFSGEELKYKWTVYGRKGDAVGEIEFIPGVQDINVVLLLEEHKTIRITAIDKSNRDIINGLKIEVYTKEGSIKRPPEGDSLTFVGDEINKTWKIAVSHREYENATISYCPAKDANPPHAELQKKQSSNRDNTKSNNDKISTGSEGYNYHKRKVPFYKNTTILACFGLLLILTFSWLFFHDPNQQSAVKTTTQTQEQSQPKPINIADEITQYCNGSELFEGKLKEYKTKNCLSKKEDYCPKIENALAIRVAINLGNLSELKKKDFSSAQQPLQAALGSMEDKYEAKIGAAMNSAPVSTMNLDQVADFITNMQKLLQIEISSLSVDECDSRLDEIDSWKLPDIPIVSSIKNQINAKKGTMSRTQEDHNPITPPPGHTPAPANTNNGALATSFWKLVNGGIEQKTSYDALLKTYRHKSLTAAEKPFLAYLIKICATQDDFDNLFIRGIRKKDRQDAKSLKDINIP